MRTPVAALLVSALLAGCSGGADGPTGSGPTVVRLVVEPSRYTFAYAGEVVRFGVTGYDRQGDPVPGGTLRWRSSDSTILRVDSTGAATALREGSARLLVTLEGVTATTPLAISYAQARLRCTTCHGDQGAHGPGTFAGTSCPACHLAALEHPGLPVHQQPAAGHAAASGGFALRAPHDTLACTGCHVAGTGQPRFTPANVDDCYTCHRAEYDSALASGKHLPGFPTTCVGCHATTQWPGAIFNHATASQGKFTLVGAHLTKPCTACHDATSGAPLFHPADQNDCITCHRAEYDSATTIGKHLPGFPTTCTSCHTTTQWPGATFDHATATLGKFTLVGAHLIQPCTVCHDATTGAPLYQPADQNDCVTCHRAEYDSATTIGKHLPGFPTTCTSCHTTTQWPGATFDHTTASQGRFTLVGAHLIQPCTVCHDATTGAPLYQPADQNDCITCHRAEYDSATAIGKHLPGFPTTCTSCHTTAQWPGATFDHTTATLGKFTLVGAHLLKPCTVCHDATTGAPLYHPADQNDCVTCHRAEYDSATAIGKHLPGFPTTCTSCHTTTQWPGATFDHTTASQGRFTLVGAHLIQPCTVCHDATTGVPLFQPADQNDCITCHRAEYDSATTIGKHLPGFPTTCTSCHTTTQWPGATFDHTTASQGRFTLVGAHLIQPCTVCHDATTGAPLYQPADQNDCITCHQSDYDNALASGKHLPGFPTTCTSCHTTTQWPGATFDHTTATLGKFTLVGAHLIQPCTVCHDATSGAPLYQPADQNDCITCHRAEYDSATAIGKHLPGFPTTCTSCHTTTQWPGATFDHTTASQGKFTLVGAHLLKPCTVCHDATSGAPLYQPADQNDCITCHQSDYDNALAIGKHLPGFPTTCTSCHTTTQWPGAVFDHDRQFFPIYSGTHRGEWSSCTTCHTVPTDYAQFSCLGCHEHSQSAMDSQHQGEPGYSYTSTACLRCHPSP